MSMVVGVCRLKLRLPESSSLKDKRQVVRSLTTRLRNKFNVAVAEVDSNDAWQIATIGITCVSNDARHAREMLDNAIEFVERTRLDAELLDSEIDVSQVF
jgi:uncharacterized protein YlxP (DUF503 family)